MIVGLFWGRRTSAYEARRKRWREEIVRGRVLKRHASGYRSPRPIRQIRPIRRIGPINGDGQPYAGAGTSRAGALKLSSKCEAQA
jgi:hypothetical protein